MKIIRIKFSYTENLIPPHCRKMRPVRFSDGVMEVEIPEISVSEAPVAIRSHGFIGFDRNKPFSVDYRWWKGKLWTAVRLSSCTPSGYTSRQNDWDHPALNNVIDVTADYGICQDYVSGIYSSASYTKSEVEKSIRDSMACHLIIDGIWHRPAGEPRYLVQTFGMGHNHGSTALFAEDFYNHNIPHDRYFSLLELDKAVALATQVAIVRKDTKSLPITVNGNETFDVLIPEAIMVNPSQQHGDGDPFMNKLQAITSIGADLGITGALVTLVAAAEISAHR